MKKIFLGIIGILFLQGLYARDFTAIRIYSELLVKGKAVLSEIYEGETRELATAHFGDGENFGFLCDLTYEGLYVLDLANIRHYLYLRPGYPVGFKITRTGEMVAGPEDVFHRKIWQWEKIREQLNFELQHLRTPGEVRERVKNFLAEVEEKETEGGGKESFFSRLYRKMVGYDTDRIVFERLKQLEGSWLEKVAFYDTSRSLELLLADPDLLRFPFGKEMLVEYVEAYCRRQTADTITRIGFIAAPELKGVYAMTCLKKKAVNYAAYREQIKIFEPYLFSERQKLQARALGAELYAAEFFVAEGWDFRYPDREGKEVAFSDFRGKIVVVDVWATWCGPCRVQLPYLKRLEEEMRGEEVVFISVSIDDDRKKWLDFLAKEQPGGIQLNTGGYLCEITQVYRISSIPRFLIFDREGRVVSPDAPWPSSPALKAMIKKAL